MAVPLATLVWAKYKIDSVSGFMALTGATGNGKYLNQISRTDNQTTAPKHENSIEKSSKENSAFLISTESYVDCRIQAY